MFLGRVVGQLWATREVSDLRGKRLLIVEPVDDPRAPAESAVKPVVVVDPVGARQGEHVLVAFGKAARVACGGDGDLAYEAAIVGIVDDVHAPGMPQSWRPEHHQTEEQPEEAR
jgi:ethanolamine utilization protein EutN